MKRFFLAAVLAASTMVTPAVAADVGVSISIGQPGFYGRVDIGDYPYPQPRVIYRQPRVVERIVIEREPIYLRVPPGHRNNWSKHCRRYNACGERVYFVRDDWYEYDYAPIYRERHYDNHDRGYRHDGYGDKGHGNKHYNQKHQGKKGNGKQH